MQWSATRTPGCVSHSTARVALHGVMADCTGGGAVIHTATLGLDGDGATVASVTAELSDARSATCLTRAMGELDDEAVIAGTIETEVVDVDGDGVPDIVTRTTTVVADLDGDGIIDVIEQTTVTAYDLDGDGVPDAIDQTTITGYDIDGDGVPDVFESTTITAVDADGDGKIDDDEITVDEAVAVRADLVEDAD